MESLDPDLILLPPEDDKQWTVDVLYQLRTLGESVARLADRFYPGDYHAAYRYLGEQVSLQLGMPWNQMTQLMRTLAHVHDQGEWADTMREEVAEDTEEAA